MEHRWGERVGVDIPVRITGHPFTVRTGRLSNLSVSGAFIRADVDVRPLSRILVAIELPQLPKRDAPMIPAFVARKLKDGIGIEWCEFKPPAINRLLQSSTARHYRHKRAGTAPGAISRLSAPLLKHGG
jgi:PilZ domain-containing protein